MRKSRIPSPQTAEDILGARLRDLKKTQEDMLVEGDTSIGPPGGGGDPDTPPDAPGCAPDATDYNELQTIDTGLTEIHGVRVQNEYAFLAGLDGTDPTLQVYRIKPDGSFALLSSLVLSQAIQRFLLHGSFIFGCRDGADGQNLISIDVGKPWAPEEKDQLDVGFAARGLDAQGCYCYVVGGDIAVVEIADPSAMRKVN